MGAREVEEGAREVETGAREVEEGTREVKRGAKQVKRVYEFLQVDASAHIKMEPCMQPNLFYCDFYQYFMKLKEYSLKSENLED